MRIALSHLPVAVRLNVSARARRFTLRLGAPGEDAVLTLPPGVPRLEAEQFLDRHAGWLDRALARQPQGIAVGPGVRLPVAGRMVEIVLAPGPRRAPVLREDALVVTGAGAAAPRIAAWLREGARAALVPAVQGYAARLGCALRGVALRDTRSRWGSCSSAGRISFSWRLAMAPPGVLDYVAAHEAAHLAEMNHGPRFWALVERLRPGHAAERAWLKREGRALHAYRFGD
ncbi:MAG: M48 family metallopeptidase [Thermohalobaculum sp.]|nr:M48 family metallopeptidase [Thermohalobaculum sp.]